jgi:valyl-tRNA synthetase
LIVKTSDQSNFEAIAESVKKLSNVGSVTYSSDKPDKCASIVLGSDEIFIPLNLEIDVEAEKKKLEADLAYAKGFLISIEKKLSNEKFVAGAPAQVLENERNKKADAEAKIKAIEESLASL